MIRKLLLSAAAASAITLGAAAQEFAIVNAKIWTGTDLSLIHI